MKNFKQRQRAYELFDEGCDNEAVAYDLQEDLALVERWKADYDADEALAGLPEDKELSRQLLGVQIKSIALRERELEAYQQEKEEQELKEKRGKVVSFKKLLNFLKKYCQRCKWTFDEVRGFILKLKKLQTQVEEVCAHDEEVFSRLFIWNRLEGLIQHLEGLVAEYSEGDTIKINFEENDLLYLNEGLEICDFDDEIEEDPEEEKPLSGLLEEEFSPKKY